LKIQQKKIIIYANDLFPVEKRSLEITEKGQKQKENDLELDARKMTEI
jgi:hypothetical protein